MERTERKKIKNNKNTTKSNSFNEKNNNFKEKDKINYKKSLGQNFLYDTNLLNAIASDGDVNSDDTVLEIGAGAGTLTAVLAGRAKKVISFEIDTTLKNILEEKQKQHPNIEFHFMDFMEADIDGLFDGKAKVVANIPYYITTPIIFKLIERKELFDSIMVLIQKEVAERFASKCGTKEYGITSVILQSLFDVTIPRVVRKECFTPAPKIDSAICKLVPHNKFNISNFEEFKKFVHLAFSMRRKTLTNNLKSQYEKEKVVDALDQCGYSDSARPEEVSVENFINIFEKLKK